MALAVQVAGDDGEGEADDDDPIAPGVPYFRCPAWNSMSSSLCDKRLSPGWVSCPFCFATFYYSPREVGEIVASRAMAALGDEAGERGKIRVTRNEAYMVTHKRGKTTELMKRAKKLYRHNKDWDEDVEYRTKWASRGCLRGILGTLKVASWDPKDKNDEPNETYAMHALYGRRPPRHVGLVRRPGRTPVGARDRRVLAEVHHDRGHAVHGRADHGLRRGRGRRL